MTNQLNAVIRVLVLVLLTSTLLFGCFPEKTTHDLYLIPESYTGFIYAIYNVDGAPPLSMEKGYDVHKINESGYLVTSEKDMDYGTVNDRYYYVDRKGKRTKISSHCVSMLPNGSYTKDEKKMDVVFTGFLLRKKGCSVEFETSPQENRNFESDILYQIEQRYYGK